MKTLRKLLFGALALSALIVATPAQARHHDHHRYYYSGHRHYYSRPVVVYRSGYYRPYYRSYSYYDYDYPRYGYYSSGPSFSIAFGGSRWHHHHH
jgi:hypothetical protein